MQKSNRMMKRLFWMLIAAGCLAVACDKTGRQPAETRFSAQFEPIGENMDAVETRSNISDAGAFVWNDWDQIDVHSSGGSFVPFALRDGAGMKTASFAGILPEGEEADGVAVYPSALPTSPPTSVLPCTLRLAKQFSTVAPYLSHPTTAPQSS